MVQKITLMEMYLIETLRANRVSDKEIVRVVKAKQVEQFSKYHDEYDFNYLYHLEDTGILEDVLQNGYQVKYLTFMGLVNLLCIKFKKIENCDYTINNFTISKLQLSEKESDVLAQILSSNWHLTTSNREITIKPVSSM